MSIQIELPAEVVNQLQRLSAREGKTPEQLVQELVTEKYGVPQAPTKFTKEEFAQQIKKIIAAHPRVAHQVDVSRDSIYEGRGE